jgi:hypothetical protein
LVNGTMYPQYNNNKKIPTTQKQTNKQME